MCETVCLCESILFSHKVCSIYQVYMKYISLAVGSLEGSKWVGFDADTEELSIMLSTFLLPWKLKCYVRMELVLP